MTTTEMIEKMDKENADLRKTTQLLLKKNRFLREQLARYCTKQEYDRIWDEMMSRDFGGDQ